MSTASFLRQLPTRSGRLANGLTVVVREDDSAPVVAIVTRVLAGYFDEPDAIAGISHVLEHMYFKGTERRGPGEAARETRAVGGYLNAGTSYDYTSYHTVLPSSALEQGFDIQSDALMHLALDEDELSRELQVIIQEARRKLDTPSAVAREGLYEVLFDVHRMRRWRIGSEAVLERLTPDVVRSYYRNLYRAANVVVAVAGDVDAGRVFELAERFYGGLPHGEPARDVGPDEPPRDGFRFRELAGEILRTYVEWGWNTPGTLHADTPPLDLLAVVLGQGRASRLYRDVREAGVVTAISAHNYTPGTVGVFGVEAELPPGDTLAALGAIAAVIGRARAAPIGEGELARARNLIEARLVRGLETAEGQATLLAEWQALGDWRLLDDYVDLLFAATPLDLRRVADRYLSPEQASLLVYRPASAPPLGLEKHDLEALLLDPASGAARSDGAARSTRANAAPPESGGFPPLREHVEDGVHFFRSGGARICIKPRRSSPLVTLSFCCRGGIVREDPARAGATALMARSSIKGTRSRSGARLAEETEALGAVVAPSVRSDFLEWSLTVPSRHFDAAAGLLLDPVLEPTFPEAEVERERRHLLGELARSRDDMARHPLRLALSTAFAGHPYGFSPEQVEAGVSSITVAGLRSWHENVVLAADPWVLVVGDVDPDHAASVIAPLVSGLRSSWRREDRVPEWATHGGVREEHRDKAQTALMLGFPGPAADHDDVDALRVLANAVGGLGGRLFEELRSRRSLAYMVSAYPIARELAGAFVAYIATAPEREEEARTQLLSGLLELTGTELPEEEVERARRYTIGARQIRSQTNGAQLSELLRAVVLGHGLSRIRDFETRIRAVTAASIRDAAARWFDSERLVLGIVRGTGGGR